MVWDTALASWERPCMCIPVNEDIEGLEGGSVKATEPNSYFGYFSYFYLSLFLRHLDF